MTLGEMIRNGREARHWSQEKLASEIGVSHGVISRVENSKNVPKVSNLIMIAQKLGIDEEELVNALLDYKKKQGDPYRVDYRDLIIRI